MGEGNKGVATCRSTSKHLISNTGQIKPNRRRPNSPLLNRHKRTLHAQTAEQHRALTSARLHSHPPPLLPYHSPSNTSTDDASLPITRPTSVEFKSPTVSSLLSHLSLSPDPVSVLCSDSCITQRPPERRRRMVRDKRQNVRMIAALMLCEDRTDSWRNPEGFVIPLTAVGELLFWSRARYTCSIP